MPPVPLIADLPPLPPDHPLSAFSAYMIKTTEMVVGMMFLLLFGTFLMILLTCYTTWSMNRMRWKLRRTLSTMEDSLETTQALLGVIKGWTIVETRTKDAAAERVLEKTAEVQRSIETVPVKAAELIAEKIIQRVSPTGEQS